ncbi:hypothetical protein MLD52_08225 [Puniceicoccaceae bacterium K14]|nr:hypothetical protein [Puniceicoccaceae bacterium K14]
METAMLEGGVIEADGDGRSLVLIDAFEGSELNDPASWSVSVSIHGSPGIGDGAKSNSYVDEDGGGFARIVEDLLMSSDVDASSLPEIEQFLVEHDNGKEYLHIALTQSLSASGDLGVKPSGGLLDWKAAVIEFGRTQNGEISETKEYWVSQEIHDESDLVFARLFVIME